MTQAVWPSWINGEPGCFLPLSERGLQFGDGLFETMVLRAGRLSLIELHLTRLFEGLVRLGIAVDNAEIRRQLDGFIQSLPASDAVIKLIVTRGSSERGYSCPQSTPASIILQSFPFSSPSADTYEQGVALFLCQTQLGWSPLLAGLKHLNRLEQVMARRELQAHNADEGLLLDLEGNVIEASASNVFWVRDGGLFTPDLQRCGVAGVIRALICCELAPALGLPVVEGHYSLSDVYQADEVFLSNALLGCMPVRQIGSHHCQVGKVTIGLMRALENHYAA